MSMKFKITNLYTISDLTDSQRLCHNWTININYNLAGMSHIVAYLDAHPTYCANSYVPPSKDDDEKPDSGSETEPEPETKAETEPEADSGSGSEEKPDSGSGSEESNPNSNSESQPQTESDSDTKSKPEQKSDEEGEKNLAFAFEQNAHKRAVLGVSFFQKKLKNNL